MLISPRPAYIRHCVRYLQPMSSIAPTRTFSFSSMSSDTAEAEAQRMRDLQELLSKFRDPKSPYYIAPGTVGPAHPDDHSSSRSMLSPPHSPRHASDRKFAQGEHDQSREAALKLFSEEGYDQRGTLEWPVAWGDMDTFQHANNVHYVRWLESARIRYCESLDLPSDEIRNMLSGKGTGFILKEVSVKYRAPVTYPDTLVIATRPHAIRQERASFGLQSAFYSLKQNKLVATADSTMVMYDYDNLRKGQMSDRFRDVLQRRQDGANTAK